MMAKTIYGAIPTWDPIFRPYFVEKIRKLQPNVTSSDYGCLMSLVGEGDMLAMDIYKETLEDRKIAEYHPSLTEKAVGKRKR